MVPGVVRLRDEGTAMYNGAIGDSAVIRERQAVVSLDSRGCRSPTAVQVPTAVRA